jgi:glutamate--cysteine ligase
LNAPLMLVSRDGQLQPLTQRITFGEWLANPAVIGRPPTREDLDYHLTTLFPPVRPRGYVEIRCIDALPDRWWPAMAAFAVTLIDDPLAADAAAEICEPVGHQWEEASRRGTAAPAMRAAVIACADLAARQAPAQLRPDLEAFAELVADGRSLCGQLRDRIDRYGPLEVLKEEAHA